MFDQSIISWRRTVLALMVPIGAVAAGCSSGNGIDTANDETTSGTGLPTSEIPTKFIAETFEFVGLDGDTGSAGNFLVRFAEGGSFEGTVEVVDADTIILVTDEFPGTDVEINYNSATGFWEWDAGTGNPVQWEVVDRGDLLRLMLVNPGPSDGFIVTGGFGFETMDMPTTGSAIYSTDSFSQVILRDATADPSDLNGSLSVSDGVALNVDFGSGGTVTGSVFKGSGLVDADNDGDDDDRFSTEILLDGTVSGSRISGTVSGGTTTLDVDDTGNPANVNLDIAASDADGRFYGDGADIVAGSWEGTFNLNDGDPSKPISQGDAIGYFEASMD
ncbi:MAG TPA: transferrin-binding protein-like solute binding protein [Spirochaetia bacterium]|nr:transferrin-binding protein-like solute binding protein [Spirochaetia bacterium]